MRSAALLAAAASMTVQAVEIVPAVAAVLPEEGLVQNTTVSLPRKAVENLG